MTRDDFLTAYLEYKWKMQMSIAVGSLFLYSGLLLAFGFFMIGFDIFPCFVFIATGFLIAFYFGNLKPRQINNTFRRKGLPEELLDEDATTK